MIIGVLALVALTSSAGAAPAERTVTLKQLRDGVAKAKAKWVGKKLKVIGVSNGVNSSTSSDETVVRVKMKLADNSFELDCRMVSKEPKELPHVGFGTPITFVGTLKKSGDALDDCTYTLGKARK